MFSSLPIAGQRRFELCLRREGWCSAAYLPLSLTCVKRLELARWRDLGGHLVEPPELTFEGTEFLVEV